MEPAPIAVATVQVSAPADAAVLGQLMQFTATARDAAGNALPGRSVVWSSSSESVATVSADGMVTAVTAGTATITATVEGKSGTTSISVTSPSGDGVAPVLKGLSFTPSTINTTTAEATVRFTVTASDVGGGISQVYVQMQNAQGKVTGSCSAFSPATGTVNNGTFSCIVTVPQGTPAGTYRISTVWLIDKVSHATEYYTAQMQAAGYPTTITVENSASDTSAPVLKGLSFTPSTINTTTAAAAVRFTVAAGDVGSGIAQVYVQMQNAQGKVTGSCTAFSPATGTVNDGTFDCVITVPQGAPAGTYRVSAVWLIDKVSHTTEYYTAQMQIAGYPTTITVQNSASDTSAPVLKGMSFTPAAVNVATAAVQVHFTVAASDVGTGIAQVYVQMQNAQEKVTGSCSAFSPVTGTVNDGTFSCDITVPQGTPSGTYRVSTVWLIDKVSHTTEYYTAQMQAAGYPTTIAVTN